MPGLVCTIHQLSRVRTLRVLLLVIATASPCGSFSCPLHQTGAGLPFRLQRRQFPFPGAFFPDRPRDQPEHPLDRAEQSIAGEDHE